MIKGIIRILVKLLNKILMPKTDLSYYSGSTIDQVLYSQIINTSVTNTIGSYTISGDYNALLQGGWPIGIYSYDGGTSYNDFVPTTIPGGSLLAHATSTTAPAVFVTPKVDSLGGGLLFTIGVKNTVGAGGTIPLIIKIAVLATSTPSATGSTPIQSSENPLAYGNTHEGQTLQNRQISIDSVSPVSTSTANIYTVSHNLGLVPNPQIWFNDGTNNTIMSNYWDVRYKPINSGNGGVAGVAMDSSNFYFSPLNALSSSFSIYRVYGEN